MKLPHGSFFFFFYFLHKHMDKNKSKSVFLLFKVAAEKFQAQSMEGPLAKTRLSKHPPGACGIAY